MCSMFTGGVISLKTYNINPTCLLTASDLVNMKMTPLTSCFWSITSTELQPLTLQPIPPSYGDVSLLQPSLFALNYCMETTVFTFFFFVAFVKDCFQFALPVNVNMSPNRLILPISWNFSF